MQHRPKGRSYITVLREPLASLVSYFNDIGNMLSVFELPDACRHTLISYCTGEYATFCQPGTGTNPRAMLAERRDPRNASQHKACVPRLPFVEWVEQRLVPTFTAKYGEEMRMILVLDNAPCVFA